MVWMRNCMTEQYQLSCKFKHFQMNTEVSLSRKRYILCLYGTIDDTVEILDIPLPVFGEIQKHTCYHTLESSQNSFSSSLPGKSKVPSKYVAQACMYLWSYVSLSRKEILHFFLITGNAGEIVDIQILLLSHTGLKSVHLYGANIPPHVLHQKLSHESSISIQCMIFHGLSTVSSVLWHTW